LKNALGRLAVFADKATNAVSLTFRESGLLLQSWDDSYGTNATERIGLETWEGDGEFRIGFNYKLLAALIGKTSGRIRFEGSTTNRALLIRTDDTRFLYLIMPIMLSDYIPTPAKFEATEA
jgi:DNA polymerase III subunit beta